MFNIDDRTRFVSNSRTVFRISMADKSIRGKRISEGQEGGIQREEINNSITTAPKQLSDDVYSYPSLSRIISLGIALAMTMLLVW